MTPTYRCELLQIIDQGSWRARVAIKDKHPTGDGVLVTSSIKMIDFERGMILTKNSLYLFEPDRFPTAQTD